MNLKDNVQKRLIIISFLMIFLIGAVSATGYGDYLDRSSEKDIVYANIKEYALRMIGEDNAVVNLLDARGLERISKTVDKDHGAAIYYALGFLMFVDEYDMHLSNQIWYIYSSLIFSVGLSALYLLCRRLQFARMVSLFAVLIVWLHPRMFAESHYNNKDMVLLSLCFCLFYFGHKFVFDNRWIDCIVYAVIGAFASNMKIIGIWIFGIIGIYYLVHIIHTKKMNYLSFSKGLICVVIWGTTYILLTPGSWDGIANFIVYNIIYAMNFSRWNDYVLFQGKLISAQYTGMPRKYLPVMILITTPIFFLISIGWGYIQFLTDIVSVKRKKLIAENSYIMVIALVGIIPLIYAVLAATSVYNGWRHFYFSYSSMVIAATYGVNKIWNWLKHSKQRCLFAGVCALYFVIVAGGIGINYPHEHSYYNVLAGNDVVNHFEMDYWEVSIRQALETICEELEADTKASVGALNTPIGWGVDGNYATLHAKNREKLTISENWENADYVVVNPSYAKMYSSDLYVNLRENYQLLHAIYSYGNIVCEVYKK